MLLDAGAEIDQRDANGITPLIAAITNNHPGVARYLIERGADVKAVDWYGRTPLWAAVETRNMDKDNATFENSIDRAPFLELIQVLIDKGADVNARTKEVPPVRNDFLRITASLSWVDFTGQTPFVTAALAGDVTVMRLLTRDLNLFLSVPKATSGTVQAVQGGRKTRVMSDPGSWKGGKLGISTQAAGAPAQTGSLGPGTFAVIDNRTGAIEFGFVEVQFQIIERAVSLTSEFTALATSNFFGVSK